MSTKKKNTEAVAEAVPAKKSPEFTKEQLAASKTYRKRKDLINALLEDGKLYTKETVDKMIANYMKGKVK